jgi:hypothetical protein
LYALDEQQSRIDIDAKLGRVAVPPQPSSSSFWFSNLGSRNFALFIVEITHAWQFPETQSSPGIITFPLISFGCLGLIPGIPTIIMPTKSWLVFPLSPGRTPASGRWPAKVVTSSELLTQ